MKPAPLDWPAGFGWLAIGALVGAWDILNQRSLTSFAQHRKCLTALVGGVTLAHLLDLLPTEVDPFDRVASVVSGLLR